MVSVENLGIATGFCCLVVGDRIKMAFFRRRVVRHWEACRLMLHFCFEGEGWWFLFSLSWESRTKFQQKGSLFDLHCSSLQKLYNNLPKYDIFYHDCVSRQFEYHFANYFRCERHDYDAKIIEFCFRNRQAQNIHFFLNIFHSCATAAC